MKRLGLVSLFRYNALRLLKVFPDFPAPLTRWTPTENERVVTLRVYFANVDHCGCCENSNKDHVNLPEHEEHEEQEAAYVAPFLL